MRCVPVLIHYRSRYTQNTVTRINSITHTLTDGKTHMFHFDGPWIAIVKKNGLNSKGLAKLSSLTKFC